MYIYDTNIYVMLHFGILQQKCQVGDCGGEERGDQAAIDLLLIGVNFLWMIILKFLKNYREETRSRHNCVSPQGVDVTIKDLEADLKKETISYYARSSLYYELYTRSSRQL